MTSAPAGPATGRVSVAAACASGEAACTTGVAAFTSGGTACATGAAAFTAGAVACSVGAGVRTSGVVTAAGVEPVFTTAGGGRLSARGDEGATATGCSLRGGTASVEATGVVGTGGGTESTAGCASDC